MAINIKSAITGLKIEEIERTIGMIITTNATSKPSRIEQTEDRVWLLSMGANPTPDVPKEQMEEEIAK